MAIRQGVKEVLLSTMESLMFSMAFQVTEMMECGDEETLKSYKIQFEHDYLRSQGVTFAMEKSVMFGAIELIRINRARGDYYRAGLQVYAKRLAHMTEKAINRAGEPA